MRYEDNNRGKIQNKERAKQLIDFSGIRYGNITPTDIDGYFEKADKAFVFYEYKLSGAEIPKGQSLALMRIVDGLSTAGKDAVLFLCRHEEENPNNEIRASGALVEKIYWHGKWHEGSGLTVKQQTDKFMNWVFSLGEEEKVKNKGSDKECQR